MRKNQRSKIMPKRAPNPNMEEVVELLRRIWSKNPDLRFCQLIGNCFDCSDSGCYYVEDEEFIARLRKVYKVKS